MSHYKYVEIENIIFQQDTYLVAEVSDYQTGEYFTIAGNADVPLEEDGRNALILTGQTIEHPKWGRQYKIETAALPYTKQTAINTLKQVNYIGNAKADVIYAQLEPFTIELMIESNRYIKGIQGLSPQNHQLLIDWFDENRDSLNMKRPFIAHGFTEKESIFLLKNHIYTDITDFKKHPYHVLDVMEKKYFDPQEDIPSFNFRKMDKLVIQNKIPIDEDVRINYAIDYLFRIKLPNDTSDTIFPLITSAMTLKNELIPETKKSLNELKDIIKKNKYTIKVIPHSNIYMHKKIQEEENYIMKRIKDNYYEEVELPNLSFNFSDEQKKAIKKCLSNKVSFLTGGPGTGKTTTTNGIAEGYRKIMNQNNVKGISIFGFAPTGRAAKRMLESISSIPPQNITTLHRLIYASSVQAEVKEATNLLIIIDESSMIDTHTLAQFLRYVPEHAKIVFVGDVDQLQPIGYGQVFKDTLEADVFPTSKLMEIHRQKNGGKKSHIIDLCNKIKHRYHIDYIHEDDCIMENTDNIRRRIIDIVELEQNLGTDLNDIQVITSFKQKHTTSSDVLNNALQPLFNPSIQYRPPHEVYKRVDGKNFTIGDRVLNLKNASYELEDASSKEERAYITNGEVGEITKVYEKDKRWTIIVKFENPNGGYYYVKYSGKQLKQLDLAYAITTHKGQGSEFKRVILPVPEFHMERFMSNNLLYTAASRAKQQLIVLGSPEVLNLMVKTQVEDKTTYFNILVNAEKETG